MEASFLKLRGLGQSWECFAIENLLMSVVGRADGSMWVRDALTRTGATADPEGLGREVGERLLASGAREVLGR